MIKKILNSQTTKKVSITTISTLVNAAIGFAFFIIAARVLGPEKFGLLSLGIAFLTLVADIGDFGTNTGIIKFTNSSTTASESNKILSASLAIKIISWLIVLIVSLLFIPAVNAKAFGNNGFEQIYLISILGVLGTLVFTFTTNSLQAKQKFTRWSLLNILSNNARLIGTGLIVYIGYQSVKSILLMYILIPSLAAVIGLFLIPNFKIVLPDTGTVKKLLNYNKWIGITVAIGAIYAKVDTLIVAKLLSQAELGIYSAAQTVASIMPQISFALAVVAAPEISKIKSKEKLLKYYQQIQIAVISISFVIILLAIIFSGFFIKLIFGIDYANSQLPFIILLISHLMLFISIPAHITIIYHFSKSKIFLPIGLVQIPIVVMASILIVPQYGASGAAFTILVGNLFNALVTNYWSIKKLYNKV